jgi:undecaprenyl-diphosphatase
MSYPQAFVLSLVQGLTEFLPISSSGHLVILQKLFGFEKPPVLFDILVHVGTLGAILFYLKDELLVAFRKIKVWWLVILGSIPAGFVGVFLNRKVETLFSSLDLVGWSLLVTAVLLFSTKRVGKLSKSVEKLSPTDAIFVGLFQALAILPGVSRSGSTIVAGLWRNIDRQAAFRFSFFI